MRTRAASWRLMPVVTSSLLVLAGCTQAGARSHPDASPEVRRTASDVVNTSPKQSLPPCDPGFGFPAARNGCPDPQPETAWLTQDQAGQLLLEPFRTFVNDAEGKAYAKAHGLDYPFANDYFDAPRRPSHALELDADTICTGVILVGYREPLEDHTVSCGSLVRTAAQQRIPVAVWRADVGVVQVSELYRP